MTFSSFERRLSFALTLAILAVAAIAGITAFGFSQHEAEEIQDDALRQMAELQTHSAPRSRTPIRVLHVPPDTAPAWLALPRQEGLYTVHDADSAVRIFVKPMIDGTFLVLMQSTDLREDVAVGAAFQALVPVLLLLPLVAWLTLKAIRSERTALDRQRRFIASAAHELRSPLTAMSVQVGNIENAPDADAARTRLGALRQALDRTRHVSEQFLALARVQTVRAKHGRVDLQPLLREIIADAIPMATARGQDLGLEEIDLPSVNGSEETLRLVIANGLDNALRYSPTGTAVTVRLKADAGHAIVEIEDRGPGIPREAMESVFEPFFRIKGAKAGGAGLGLAIARDAATTLDGEIELVGLPQQGLLFRYRQPRCRT